MARAWARHPVVSFIRHRSQVTFYRQLGTLLGAGIPLPTAFGQLARYAPGARLARVVEAVGRDVQAGAGLAEAMGRHAGELDDANIELIAFAEESGKLQPVIKRIVDHLDRVQSLRWRAILLMIWPAYLAAAMLFAGPLLDVARAVRPGASVGAMYLSSLGSSLTWVGLFLAGLFLVPLLLAALGLEAGWDRLKRRLPLVSRSVRDLYGSRFLMTMAMGSAAGLETHRMLRAGVLATRSPSLAAALGQAESALRSGATLTEAVERLSLLDGPTLGTLAVGEATGTLDEALDRASLELEKAAVRATQILMIVVVAGLAIVLLVKIVTGILGVVLGPIKRFYDAAGTGNLDRM